jgi:hypothetical protein
MSYEINWHAQAGSSIIQNELYQAFSTQTIGAMDLSTLKSTLDNMRINVDTAPIVWYICTCIRAKTLAS